MSEGFVPILPFDKSNPLPKEVESDHAPLCVEFDNCGSIMMENISNPAHHHYFGNGPFKDTHMNVPKPLSDGVLEISLVRKTSDQVRRVYDCLTIGDISAYVIIEGFKSFYEALAMKLYGKKELNNIFKTESPKSFAIVVPPMEKDFRNTIGIVLRNDKYNLLEHKFVTHSYYEDDVPKKLNITAAEVLGYDGKRVTIVGVHVSGCDSQFPKAGLSHLAKELIELQRVFNYSQYMIVMGDFNTTPAHVDETVMKDLHAANLCAARLRPNYFTHVNPYYQAVVYDHAIIIFNTICKLTTVDALPKAGKALACAIADSVEKHKRQKTHS